jgi:flavodoxin
MKVLVAYLSKTGNTKKVAEAIFQEISDEKEMKPIDKVNSIEGYDVAFLGFPIHGMGPDKKEEELLKKYCVNRRNVALFITHMAPEGVGELPAWLDKFRQAACGANIVDMFDCQGQVAKPIKLFMLMSPDAKLRSWAKQDNSRGQPDEARLDRARAFSRNVMKKLHDSKAEAGSKRGKQEE